MRLLLDTNAFLWWMEENIRLGDRAKQTIAAPENEILLSAIVVWEIAIKRALDRLDLTAETGELVDAAVEVLHFTPLPFFPAHALAVERLLPIHRDPFDRALIAQAGFEGAVLLTSDRIFAQYPVETADALT